MGTPLRTLIIEDSEDDALLLVRILHKGGYDPAYERVETADTMNEALERGSWDIIICDYNMPHFNGYGALALFKEKKLDIPFIIVSGAIGEETAVAIMVSGAHDYVMKNNLPRLVPSVRRELKEAQSRRERKQAEEALKQSENRMSNIINFLPDATFAIDLEGKIILWNRAIEEMTGFSAHSMLGKGDYEYAIPFYGKRRPILINFLFSWDKDIEKEYYFIRKEGDTLFTETNKPCIRGQLRTLWGKASPLRDDQGKMIGAIESIRDISSRAQAEVELKSSEQKYRGIFENAVMGIFRTTPAGHYLSINPAGARMYGYQSEEEMRQSVTDMAHQIYTHPEDRKRLNELLETSGFVEGFEVAHYTKDGSIIWVSLNIRVICDNSGAILYYETTSQNITSRKNVEEALRISEQKYRSIFENSVEGVFQTTPEGRFLSVNPAVANLFGYASPQEFMEEIIDIGRQHYANPKDRKTYKSTLEREGIIKGFEVQLINKEGNPIWASINARVNRNNEGAIISYEGTVVDITERKQAEENLKETTEKLRMTLIGTIQAMSLTVETRDPYTAGHQRRVSKLARVIAQEMALPNDIVDTIRTAGILHDIGKIAVPSEILSKPTKLTDIEFSLIKVHPQSGYDILKDVGFPCNLAMTVLQHHERLDGSGYPQGLKNGQILQEAKILAVADVVEAIASHRPYRPAKGIDAALEEIEKHRDALYDAEVVEACTKLFREKGFSFE